MRAIGSRAKSAQAFVADMAHSINDDGAGHDNRDGKDPPGEKIGIDPVREAKDEGEPDKEHDQRDSVADAIDGITGKITALGIYDVFFLSLGIGIHRLDDVLGDLLHVGKQAHEVPPMITHSGVHNPVFISHHFVKALEDAHGKGSTQYDHNKQQYDIGYFHRHGSFLPYLIYLDLLFLVGGPEHGDGIGCKQAVQPHRVPGGA